MLNVFSKVLVRCEVCDTPTDERYKRGGKYYCVDHFHKLDDENTDKQTQEADRKLRKLMNNPNT